MLLKNRDAAVTATAAGGTERRSGSDGVVIEFPAVRTKERAEPLRVSGKHIAMGLGVVDNGRSARSEPDDTWT